MLINGNIFDTDGNSICKIVEVNEEPVEFTDSEEDKRNAEAMRL